MNDDDHIERLRAREEQHRRRERIHSNIHRIATRDPVLHAIQQALTSTQGALKTAIENNSDDRTITALASAMDQLEAAINTAQQ